ncbi:hypothetical protein WOB59_00355 [Methylocystis sp. IM4]|uniref:hypothetical protein n=1 Tax=Methylocystis sp. IM4 TaxID=3136560 RepID=UPI003119ED34
MMRQYYAQRRRGGDNPKGVGVIAVGSIYYLQDDSYFRDRFRGAPSRRNPWTACAFLNGVLGAGRRNADTGKWESVYVSGRSDMALVQSLRDGRMRTIAVRTLILHDDLGLCKGVSEYPSLPRLASCNTNAHPAIAA